MGRSLHPCPPILRDEKRKSETEKAKWQLKDIKYKIYSTYAVKPNDEKFPLLTQDLFYVCIRGQTARAVSLMADSCRGQIYLCIVTPNRYFTGNLRNYNTFWIKILLK